MPVRTRTRRTLKQLDIFWELLNVWIVALNHLWFNQKHQKESYAGMAFRDGRGEYDIRCQCTVTNRYSFSPFISCFFRLLLLLHGPFRAHKSYSWSWVILTVGQREDHLTSEPSAFYRLRVTISNVYPMVHTEEPAAFFPSNQLRFFFLFFSFSDQYQMDLFLRYFPFLISSLYFLEVKHPLRNRKRRQPHKRFDSSCCCRLGPKLLDDQSTIMRRVVLLFCKHSVTSSPQFGPAWARLYISSDWAGVCLVLSDLGQTAGGKTTTNKSWKNGASSA